MALRLAVVSGAMGVALATLLTGGEVRAQACALPAFVPEEVYLFYGERLSGLPNLDEKGCTKLTKGAVSTCNKAVRASSKCWATLVKGTLKAQKIECAATDDPKGCTSFFQAEAVDDQASIDAAAEDASAVCVEDFASAVFSTCLGL